jgi:DNA polymerase sigma
MNKSVKYLGILIKMWAKKTGHIGQNRLSSYSFVLMMIYYLVTKKMVPNILRSVENSDYAENKITIRRCKQLG